MLKLLILKFVKNVKVKVVMRQHNFVCVRAFCVNMCAGLQSGIPLQTERGGITPPFLNLGVRAQTLRIDFRVRESPIRLGRRLCRTRHWSGPVGEANETSLASLESSVDSAVIEAVDESL